MSSARIRLINLIASTDDRHEAARLSRVLTRLDNHGEATGLYRAHDTQCCTCTSATYQPATLFPALVAG